MFTKSAILVILGCTLVLASPVQESRNHKIERTFLGTFAEWLHKADEALSSVIDHVKQPFEKLYHSLVETGEGVVDYGMEKVQQVVAAYYDIKSKSEVNMNEIKNTFLAELIVELLSVLEKLTDDADTETLKQLKEKTKQIAASGKESLVKLQQQLQEAIDAEKKQLEDNLKKWETEANSVIKQKFH